MQLLELPVLEVFLTAFVICAGSAALLTLVVWRFKPSRASIGSLLIAAFSFALLGFVTGSIMADSRQPAVGAVLPAVLTLLGGVLVYLIGTKGHEKQVSVSALVIVFVADLYIGCSYGSRLRYEYEVATTGPAWLHDRDLALEQNRQSVEIRRLLNYIQLQKLKSQLSKSTGIDLSRFVGTSERPAESGSPPFKAEMKDN